jgi:hypothetical protein
MTNTPTPFGKLSIDERVALFRAHLEGSHIELFEASGEWEPVDNPAWHADACYRLAPDIPDQIDWSHVAPAWRFMARDADGWAYLWTSRPKKSFDDWSDLASCEGARVDVFASYRRGTVAWDQSLVERPEVGEKVL